MKAMACNKPPDMKLEYEQNRGFHEYGMIIYQNAKIGRKSYHSLHEICKAKRRKGLVKNCKFHVFWVVSLF
jgi:hypothetical protein